MQVLSYISNAEPAVIEDLYKQYKHNPETVDSEWARFFHGFDFATTNYEGGVGEQVSAKEFQVYALISAYRNKGHLIASTNPIRPRKDRNASLELSFFGLTEADLNAEFIAGELIGLGKSKLEAIIQHLKATYCGNTGIEYDYIHNAEEVRFIQEAFEHPTAHVKPAVDKQKRILHKLNQSVVFETFLHKKYIGQKRFSLEGGETTIPALDAIITSGAEQGVQEVVIGMAHRGRLNVLVNILGKTYEQIFTEFEGTYKPDLTMGDGDVKYHLGYSSIIQTPNNKEVNLKLTPNPSHLETVDPIVEGYVRAKGDLLYNSDYKKVLPILIHGDAAVAGQGVVYEVLQMSQLAGYKTGGTIHFVINNQIGFTTDFDDARTSDYCTSIAATIAAPVFHVNGDDPEAVVYAAEVAIAYRQRFGKDVFIDMVCYRKHGHNEGDDPKYTQPSLYKLIEKHKNPRELYASHLVKTTSITEEESTKLDEEFWNLLQDRLDMVKEKPLPYLYQKQELAWKKLRKSKVSDFDKSPNTAITQSLIDRVIAGLIRVPEGFKPLRKVQKMLEQRREIFNNEKTVDWASGELLAYGTLLLEGNDVRMTGQDVKRGTFSHRHAVLFDEETNEQFNRLDKLEPNQASRFRIYNSLLSEYGVLGFEFGYSWATPNTLTIWEAQFGDFSNGAQIIIDQYLSSAESKWQRSSGLVMLLPHGYEGQGPEHSSARFERFLQLCAEQNMIVTNITTPANLFHALRRQVRWEFRKPMVNMSPKSLLRHAECISPISDLLEGGFKEVIVDPLPDASKAKRIVFCTGKVYYDLAKRAKETNNTQVVIARVEQLYPVPHIQIAAVIAQSPNAEVYWVQEEPENMGAWTFMLSNYRKANWNVISRKPSASPATGYSKIHEQEQEHIISSAFTL